MYWNYCPNCGKRLVPNEKVCKNCGYEVISIDNDEFYRYAPPVHNIGFFNFRIDFSPYIVRNIDYEYDICSCGYLNIIDNEFCPNCGVKRIEKGLSRLVRNVKKPKFIIRSDNDSTRKIICKCGAVNLSDSIFCEMCGRELVDDLEENFINYKREFENSVFCSCGQENDGNGLYCVNCGLPLDSYSRLNDIKILCVCSVLNDLSSEYCAECGNSLTEEVTEIICVCGTRNPVSSRKCSSCEKPLDPERVLKTKLVCSCGKIMSFDSEYCPNCGKDIKKSINRRKGILNGVKSIKNILNGI